MRSVLHVVVVIGAEEGGPVGVTDQQRECEPLESGLIHQASVRSVLPSGWPQPLPRYCPGVVPVAGRPRRDGRAGGAAAPRALAIGHRVLLESHGWNEPRESSTSPRVGKPSATPGEPLYLTTTTERTNSCARAAPAPCTWRTAPDCRDRRAGPTSSSDRPSARALSPMSAHAAPSGRRHRPRRPSGAARLTARFAMLRAGLGHGFETSVVGTPSDDTPTGPTASLRTTLDSGRPVPGVIGGSDGEEVGLVGDQPGHREALQRFPRLQASARRPRTCR